MLLSYEFIKAENEYRRELMRDQARRGQGTLRKASVAVVVAAAFLIAACGMAVESDAGSVIQNRIFDDAPAWQPNHELLEKIISGSIGTSRSVVPAIEYGGMAAPSWQPNLSALESATQPQRASVNDLEPTWIPNFGRLETRLGADPVSGPR